MKTSLIAILSAFAPLWMMADAATGGGSSMAADTGFISLADLAGANTDDVKAITSRLPPAGIFRVRILSAAITEAPAQEGKAQMFRLTYKYEVIVAKPVDKNLDAEKIVGGNFTESFPIYASDLAQSIGLLKGRHQLAGLPNSGIMGGVEGQEPGWIDAAITNEVDIRIRHGANERAYFDWLKPEAAPSAEDAPSA